MLNKSGPHGIFFVCNANDQTEKTYLEEAQLNCFTHPQNHNSNTSKSYHSAKNNVRRCCQETLLL